MLRLGFREGKKEQKLKEIKEERGLRRLMRINVMGLEILEERKGRTSQRMRNENQGNGRTIKREEKIKREERERESEKKINKKDEPKMKEMK